MSIQEQYSFNTMHRLYSSNEAHLENLNLNFFKNLHNQNNEHATRCHGVAPSRRFDQNCGSKFYTCSLFYICKNFSTANVVMLKYHFFKFDIILI